MPSRWNKQQNEKNPLSKSSHAGNHQPKHLMLSLVGEVVKVQSRVYNTFLNNTKIVTVLTRSCCLMAAVAAKMMIEMMGVEPRVWTRAQAG